MTVGGSGACTATGQGLRRAYTGIPATFQILASQAGLVETGIVRISVTGAVNKKECKVRVRDNQNGTYDVAYLTEVVGAYFINITNNERHIPGGRGSGNSGWGSSFGHYCWLGRAWSNPLAWEGNISSSIILANIACSCSVSTGSPFKLDAQLGPDPTKCTMGGPALQANAILQVSALLCAL